MALGISVVSTGLMELAQNFRRASVTVRPELVRAMTRSTILTERVLKKDGLDGKKGHHSFWGVTGAPGSTLGARSGKTRQSVTQQVFTSGPVVIGAVGVPGKAFAAHESGATITGSPYLRQPTAAAQTPAGVDRYAGQSLRGVPGLFSLRSKAGNLWIATRSAGQLVLMYMLRRSVTLRARHVLRHVYGLVRDEVNLNFRGAAGSVVATVTGR